MNAIRTPVHRPNKPPAFEDAQRLECACFSTAFSSVVTDRRQRKPAVNRAPQALRIAALVAIEYRSRGQHPQAKGRPLE